MSEAELADVIWSQLWSDLDEQTCFPARRPRLTHYTSVQVLESMARTNQFWLSHPMLMNDHEEMHWGVSESRRLLELHEGLRAAIGSHEAYRSFREAYERVVSDYGSGDAFNVYISCFCEHSATEREGLLSMWRAYGANGGGAALVFDTSVLTPNEDSPLIIHPITYASTEQRTNWIEGKLQSVAAAIKGREINFQWLAEQLFERFKIFSLFTKHNGFSEEREWRLAYLPERDKSKLYSNALSYTITERGIQPKLKIELRPDSPDVSIDLESVVSEVVLGPTAGSPLARMATERMLEQCGKPKLASRISACTTPFRP